MRFWKRNPNHSQEETSETVHSQEETEISHSQKEKMKGPTNQEETIETSSSQEETKESPPSQEETVNDHPSQEDLDKQLQASGLCLVNRNYVPPWLTTPFPDSYIPQVSHHVSLIEKDLFYLYDQETGEMIGIRHSSDTPSQTQVETGVTGQSKQDDVTRDTASFKDIRLNPGSSRSTVYKEPGVIKKKVSEHDPTVTPLIKKGILKRKDIESNIESDFESHEESESEEVTKKSVSDKSKSKHNMVRTGLVIVVGLLLVFIYGVTIQNTPKITIQVPTKTQEL